MSTTLLAAALAMRLVASHGYPEGAPPGFSGGFGEPACDACHFEAAVNTGPGKVLLAGAPDRFSPGERYTLTITFTRPGMKLAGFQLTARFRDGGGQAGSLAPAPDEEARLAVESQGGVEYAGQHADGTALAAPDTASWKLVWTAPDADGPVVFHVAANAANEDGTAEGDYVHTTTAESSPAAVAVPPLTSTSRPSSSWCQSAGSTSATGIVTP